MDKVTILIESYDEQFDTFAITRTDDGSAYRSLIPAFLAPAITGEYGSPDEFIGRLFDVRLP